MSDLSGLDTSVASLSKIRCKHFYIIIDDGDDNSDGNDNYDAGDK